MHSIPIVQWFDINQVGFLFEPSIEIMTILASGPPQKISISGTNSLLDSECLVLFDKIYSNEKGTDFLLSKNLHVAHLPTVKSLPIIEKNGNFIFRI